MISQDAIDLIVEQEVSSKDYYITHYQRPEWPGGASGITVGIGYDLGYADQSKIRKDWTDKLDGPVVLAMCNYAGMKGGQAHDHLAAARSQIIVSWDAAMAVFMNNDIPHWIEVVHNALPNTDKLSPDSLGALVSLAYNRGASFSNAGGRYAEMRAIKAHMANEQFNLIPQDFRSMKRLWPSVRGLQLRRDAEAVLFEKGLHA